jgi:hypothetical protein
MFLSIDSVKEGVASCLSISLLDKEIVPLQLSLTTVQ